MKNSFMQDNNFIIDCEKLNIKKHLLQEQFLKNNNAPVGVLKENDKTNIFIKNAFSNYKKNLKEMYDTYVNNPDYTQFINVLNKSAIERQKNGNANNEKNMPKFLQKDKNSEIDFSSLLDDKKRHKMTENFVNTLSSDSFIKEVKNEYNEYKNTNLKEVYGKVSEFYNKENKESLNDEHNKKVGSRFMNSVNNYIKNHMEEYRQDGILTLNGSIDQNPGKYIESEEKLLKANYHEEKYTLGDIDKIMKLDQILK